MSGLDFAGRVAVVAGGCGGIGQAVRARLAAAGANIIVWDLADGADTRLDLTDEGAVNDAMNQLIARWGRIDVLVNAAGITGPTVNIEHYTFADWRRVIDVNLTATFLCCRAAVAPMPTAEQRAHRQSGVHCRQGRQCWHDRLFRRQAAVIALTKSLGKELADTAIRVNAIAPAVIATELIKQMSADVLKGVLAKIPLGRPGRPEEVAALVAWLASRRVLIFDRGRVRPLRRASDVLARQNTISPPRRAAVKENGGTFACAAKITITRGHPACIAIPVIEVSCICRHYLSGLWLLAGERRHVGVGWGRSP